MCPDNKVRPRVICNPDDRLKLYGGWVNYHILKALKTCSWFVQGYNTHETAKHIEEHIRGVPDGVFLA